MKNVAARYCAASWFGIVLVLMLGTSSCKEEEGEKRPRVTGKGPLDCGDKTVTVQAGSDPTKFATPEAVYVCEGDVVTWEPASDVQTFDVDFKKDYPFEGNKKKFNKGDRKSPKLKPQKKGLTVYPYTITVNGVPYDPQVVGGGGN